ncbi:MAG: tyrosine-type recombinase/integrase, partial [Abditibacteriota bacterium]|nr:tyrosine-type recombinase/integrase [Abditibacteriota bacterium]
FLRENQLADGTIQRYKYSLYLLVAYAGNCLNDIIQFRGFKDFLIEMGLSIPTMNGIIGNVNKFMKFLNEDWRIRRDKIQRQAFLPPDKELTADEYHKMLDEAMRRGNRRLAMMVETLCGTGIRVSELQFITVESLSIGRAEVLNKGKTRMILLPPALVRNLEKYCEEKGISSGPIFVTRTGRPLDRSNIWKMLKRLGELVGVVARKVFPHNLRHLFARTYYEKSHDLARLADILGHSSVNTTRIYTANSGQAEQQFMDTLGLIPVSPN